MKPRRLLGVALICWALLLSLEARGDVSFILDIGAGYAGSEQENVRLPVFLSNSDSVDAWEILIEYDDSIATVTGVELCDSIFVADSIFVGDSLHLAPGTYYAPWYGHPELRPEYFDFYLNVHGNSGWVKTEGIMNMDFPLPFVPPIPPGDARLFFCLTIDVNYLWEAQLLVFRFHTRNCFDNTLASDEVTWGPDTLSAPPSSCPIRPDSLRVVHLLDGYVPVSVLNRGDVNCDDVPYSVADAVMYFNYLISGVSALSGCESFEVHSLESDVNLNATPWEIADFVTLLRVINGYQNPPQTPPDTTDLDTVWVTTEEEPDQFVIETTSDVPLAATFSFSLFYDPEELTINLDSIVLAERVQHLNCLFGADTGSGELIIVLCDLFTSDSIAAGGGPLVIIPTSGSGHLTLQNADLCDPRGGLLQIQIPPVGIDIIEPSRRTVDRFTLSQNYPNPFNPTTEITYNLPVDCHVRLEIHNISGQRVAILVDEKQPAGYKTIHWDSRSQTGNEVSSGIYFYRLQAGDFVETRKMILLQ